MHLCGPSIQVLCLSRGASSSSTRAAAADPRYEHAEPPQSSLAPEPESRAAIAMPAGRWHVLGTAATPMPEPQPEAARSFPKPRQY